MKRATQVFRVKTLLVACGIAIAAAGAMSAEDRVRANEAEPVIVAFGDSLTAGFGLAAGDAFPAQLERALRAKGQNVRVVNAGVSGDTAADGLARFDWSMPQDASAVIIELGANDALRGLDPATTNVALETIITQAKARGLPVLLAGMEAPRNMGEDYVEQFGAIYTGLAAKYDVSLYPFFLDGVALDPGFSQPDGLHPTASGIGEVVKRILPDVEALVQRISQRKTAAK